MVDEPRKRPVIEHPAVAGWRGANSARATYGLILLMSVLAVWTTEDDPDGTEVLVSVAATSLVFWIAHVYSEVIARRIREERGMTGKERREMLAQELPIMEVAIPSIVLLALAIAGAMTVTRAIDVSIYVSLGALGALGWFSARSSGARGFKLALFTAVSLGLGVAIVLLKTLIH